MVFLISVPEIRHGMMKQGYTLSKEGKEGLGLFHKRHHRVTRLINAHILKDLGSLP